ncbi:MAG: GNAT family N-acetyltransferase [Candidatus Moraniibacteriota bacterium]
MEIIKGNFNNLEEINFAKANEFNEKYLSDILMLERECFPESWLYSDASEYYMNALKNKNNINIFLKKNNQTVGYILAIPHNDMVEDLLKDDGFLEKKDNFYYIETIQIITQSRGSGGAEKLLKSVCEEAVERGVNNFSIHARLLNGFADKLKKIFEGKVSIVRNIESWKYGGDEPYEYIEWSY